MRTRTNVTLDGVEFAGLDGRLVLHDVEVSAPSMKETAASMGGGVGQIVTGRQRDYIQVTLKFAVAQIRDYVAHADAVDSVNAWAANGGRLQINNRPGRHLYVTCTQLASEGVVNEWTADYSVTFKAFNVPYWVENVPQSASRTNNGTVTLYNAGTAETPLEWSVTASAGGSNQSISVMDAARNKIEFTGLTIASGDVFVLTHNGPYLVATQNGTSILHKRTAASADELMLKHGNNTLTLSCGVNAAWTVTARGRWH